jgi:hypothetical protein
MEHDGHVHLGGSPVVIESVELVSVPDAPAWQEKVYRAHLDSGEDVDLFQSLWDVPISPESLIGLTPEEARKVRIEKVIAAASHSH